MTEQDAFNALIASLRRRRQHLGLTQEALEMALGWTKGHICKFENGIRRPTGWNLSIWVVALGGQLQAEFPPPAGASVYDCPTNDP
jgi:hypothetical protein